MECIATAKERWEPHSCSDTTVKRGASGCSFKASKAQRALLRWSAAKMKTIPPLLRRRGKSRCPEGNFWPGCGQGSWPIQSMLLGQRLTQLPLCLHANYLHEAFCSLGQLMVGKTHQNHKGNLSSDTTGTSTTPYLSSIIIKGYKCMKPDAPPKGKKKKNKLKNKSGIPHMPEAKTQNAFVVSILLQVQKKLCSNNSSYLFMTFMIEKLRAQSSLRRFRSPVQLQLSTQLWFHHLHDCQTTNTIAINLHVQQLDMPAGVTFFYFIFFFLGGGGETHFPRVWNSFCITNRVTLCFHPNYCKGQSFSQPPIGENNPLIFSSHLGEEEWKSLLRNPYRRLFPVRLKGYLQDCRLRSDDRYGFQV